MAGSADEKRWAILPPPSAETAAWTGPLLPGRTERSLGKRVPQRGESSPSEETPSSAQESAIQGLEPASSTRRTQRHLPSEAEAEQARRQSPFERQPAAPSSLPAAGDSVHESTGIRKALDARLAEARARSIEARKRQAQENVETLPAPPPGDEMDD